MMFAKKWLFSFNMGSHPLLFECISKGLLTHIKFSGALKLGSIVNLARGDEPSTVLAILGCELAGPPPLVPRDVQSDLGPYFGHHGSTDGERMSNSIARFASLEHGSTVGTGLF